MHILEYAVKKQETLLTLTQNSTTIFTGMENKSSNFVKIRITTYANRQPLCCHDERKVGTVRMHFRVCSAYCAVRI